MQSSIRVTILLLCAAGAWISAELVKEQASPWPSDANGPQLYTGLCGSSGDAQSDCAAVFASRWSAIDFDVPLVSGHLTLRRSRVVVPTAFIGLGYFVFLGIWHAFAGSPRAWRRWYVIPLMTALGGAAGSAFLLWVMRVQLEAQCTWCLATHVINGVLLFCTLCLWPARRRSTLGATTARSATKRAAPDVRRLSFGSALRVAGFAVVVIGGLWVYRSARLDIRNEVAKFLPYRHFVDELEHDPAFLLREYRAQPQHAIPARLTDGDNESTLADASVVIFSDFGCSHCACFAGKWRHEFRREWQGPVRVSFRHAPPCEQYNQTPPDETEPEACRAARAAEAARLQGGDDAFWHMHDLLFAQNRRLGTVPYRDLAAQIGLDGDRLAADMQSSAVASTVAADAALAAELGVTNTPTVFLDGRRVPLLCLNNPVFWRAIAFEFSPDGHPVAVKDSTEESDWDLSTETTFATATVNP